MTAHVVANRYVLTYEPEGRPTGVLTGYDDEGGGFGLEHVIAFPEAPAGTLLALVRLGLEEAWRRDFQYVTLGLREGGAPGLARLAQRMGFTQYASCGPLDFYVSHRP